MLGEVVARHKVVSEAALSLRKCLLREVATSGIQ